MNEAMVDSAVAQADASAVRMSTVGRTLREAREAAGLSIDEIARMLNVARVSAYRWVDVFAHSIRPTVLEEQLPQQVSQV